MFIKHIQIYLKLIRKSGNYYTNFMHLLAHTQTKTLTVSNEIIWRAIKKSRSFLILEIMVLIQISTGTKHIFVGETILITSLKVHKRQK